MLQPDPGDPVSKRPSHAAKIFPELLSRVHTRGANQQVPFDALNLVGGRGAEQKYFQRFVVNMIVNHLKGTD